MRLLACQYLCHTFVKQFIPVIKRHYNKSSKLDDKNNHEYEYTKIVS